MLSPRVEARMLQDLHVQQHESVLEIGTGSGFMAALLAHRAAHVLTLEIDADPGAQRAPRRCGATASRNVEVRHADGASPLPSGPTFDVIVLSGSVARVPQNLLGSLKVGGRLAAIVGDEPMMRAHFVTARRRRQVGHHPALGHRGAAPAELSRALALQLLTRHA